MSPEQLAAIKGRVEAAAKGPWRRAPGADFFFLVGADADFATHARDDVPALVAEVERLRQAAAHVCKMWHRQNSGPGTRLVTALGIAIRDMVKVIGWKP